jgi:hypothetical protein
MHDIQPIKQSPALLVTRGYQEEMLKQSLHQNTIIALDTGSGKTHIAVLRLKHEMEKGTIKVGSFLLIRGSRLTCLILALMVHHSNRCPLHSTTRRVEEIHLLKHRPYFGLE